MVTVGRGLRAAVAVGLSLVAGSGAVVRADAGAAGGPGLAIRARKILTCAQRGPQVHDRGVLLVRDGAIEAVGRADEVAVPEGYEVLDVGERWLMPGMIDLHCHVAGGLADLNDLVYLAQPELRASATVTPGNPWLEWGCAAGVTSVLLIPGSGVNVGGQGVLLKTGSEHYEENLIRDPGSLKLAQWGNPEGWATGVAKTFEGWSVREVFLRGKAYAERWKAFEEGRGPEPIVDPQWEVFRDLVAGEIAVSAHTQIYQVVLTTITMVRQELGLPVFIDHGTFDGYKAAALAQEAGVPAILGPRNADVPTRWMSSFAGVNPERVQGVAAGYQERGHELIGFNTDSIAFPGITVEQHELPLQGAIAARLGFRDDELQTVRGLTIVPAIAARIDDQVGSLEVGKDADVLVIDGHPCDPRTAVQTVFVDGRRAYERREARPW